MADKALLDALADELEVIASWHTGPKYVRIMTLVDKLRAVDSGPVTPEAVKAYSTATTVAPLVDEQPPEDLSPPVS